MRICGFCEIFDFGEFVDFVKIAESAVESVKIAESNAESCVA
ncbi:hypothetical protein [Helicobacter sp. 23-1045]